jgi:oxaloacetate decarboxylase alpha subunit
MPPKRLLRKVMGEKEVYTIAVRPRPTAEGTEPLPEMDKIPYFSVECWGGATFDSCIRFLDEDPWERLRILRKELPHQKLQMLFRGQNMLGYRPYADDAVQYFVQKSVANGIDVIRIFDALNDPRNLKTAIKAANKEGAHVQACISYTLSPVHNNEYFANYAKTLEEMGADSICIKDMAGLLKPYTCYELVSELKKTVKIPVDIHSHYTAGLASMSILKGIEAGADIVDTAMSPLALGTSHMPTESLVAALQGTDYDTGLDLNQLNVVRAYFNKLREKYIANGQINQKSLGVDANTLLYQVPGGMFSNMLKQLKDAGKEDKLDEVLAEIPRVREDAGYPPLVTPTSQIVGTQAVFNVIMGERYKMVTKEFKGLVHGDSGIRRMKVIRVHHAQVVQDCGHYPRLILVKKYFHDSIHGRPAEAVQGDNRIVQGEAVIDLPRLQVSKALLSQDDEQGVVPHEQWFVPRPGAIEMFTGNGFG